MNNCKRVEYTKYSHAIKNELAKCAALHGNLIHEVDALNCMYWITWLLISDPQNLISEMF